MLANYDDFVSHKHCHGIPPRSVSKTAHRDKLNENPMLFRFEGKREIEFKKTECNTGLSGKQVDTESSKNNMFNGTN